MAIRCRRACARQAQVVEAAVADNLSSRPRPRLQRRALRPDRPFSLRVPSRAAFREAGGRTVLCDSLPRGVGQACDRAVLCHCWSRAALPSGRLAARPALVTASPEPRFLQRGLRTDRPSFVPAVPGPRFLQRGLRPDRSSSVLLPSRAFFSEGWPDGPSSGTPCPLWSETGRLPK